MAKKTFKDKFQRFETKYVISKEVLANLLTEFEEHMVEDEHAYSTISNLYYDTPTFQMIRESLEKPYFKEKLRVRTYDETPTEDSQVFLEIKKKVRKIDVYKRQALQFAGSHSDFHYFDYRFALGPLGKCSQGLRPRTCRL